MDHSLQKLAAALPRDLQNRFAVLERRLFRVETALAATSAVVGLSASYLVLFVSDRWWDSPSWFRVASFAAGAILGVRSAYVWGSCWGWARRDLRALAMMVQKRFRRLGDRLLGIVELADESHRPPNFSPELYQAAITQVADQAAAFDFSQAVETSRLRRISVLAASLILLTLIPFVIVPSVGVNTLARLLLPWKQVPRLTLVELQGLPTEIIVPHGESFFLEGRSSFRTPLWQPNTLRFMAGGMRGSAKSGPKDTWVLQIPAQLSATLLRIRLGDAESFVQIKPTFRPALSGMTASLRYPEYLGYPVTVQNVQGANFSAVAGSVITLQGSATRSLASAYFLPPEGTPKPLVIDGTNFTSPSFELVDITDGAFGWVDHLGLSNSTPRRITLQPQPDLAPSPEFLELPTDLMILESEVLAIKLAVQDDFGVKQMGLLWEILGRDATNLTSLSRFQTDATNSLHKKLEASYSFTPSLLGAGTDTTLIVRGVATDFFPGREPVMTSPRRIQVVGNEQHAEAVRQKLESLMSQLEEVARSEEKVAHETSALQENKSLGDAAAAKRSEELKLAQEQNADQLQGMSEEGLKTLREAMRNPTFSEKVLGEWNKTLREMQEVAKQSMTSAAKKLGDAAKGSQSSEERKQNLAEAKEKEEEALEELQQLQKKVNRGLDTMQALTLAQRLRKIGVREHDLEMSLLKSVQETIGLALSELNLRQTKALTLAAEDQTDTQKETSELSVELNRFFERTQKENYGKVSKEIQSARAPEELERIRGLIRENVAMEAMQNLSLWSDKFVAWADILEPPRKKDKGSEGASSGGDGESKPDTAMQQLIELLRLRESQVNVQERTRLLEEQRIESEIYQRGSKRVADSQDEIKHRIGFLSDGNSLEFLKEPLASAEGQTAAATELLRKPLTDAPTQKFQQEAVALLSDAINLLNEEQQRQKEQKEGSQSEAEEMAMMMKLMAQRPGQGMGLAPGQQAGANMSGGDTAERAKPLSGNTTGKSADARNAAKASGTTLAVPTEFREALSEFYKLIEQEPN